MCVKLLSVCLCVCVCLVCNETQVSVQIILCYMIMIIIIFYTLGSKDPKGQKQKIKTSRVTSGPVGRLRRNHAKARS